MSVERLYNLEGRVERLAAALDAVRQQAVSNTQQLWPMSGLGGGQGGGTGSLVPAFLTANLAAGSPTAPTSASGNLMAPGGTLGDAITIYSGYSTAITVSGPKLCWVTFSMTDARYYLVVADC